jgi:hypothetical protein
LLIKNCLNRYAASSEISRTRGKIIRHDSQQMSMQRVVLFKTAELFVKRQT